MQYWDLYEQFKQLEETGAGNLSATESEELSTDQLGDCRVCLRNLTAEFVQVKRGLKDSEETAYWIEENLDFDYDDSGRILV
jgi:hypothetical protein